MVNIMSGRVDVKSIAGALGWLSIGLGLAEIAVPGTVSRIAGVPENRKLLRFLGAREIASGTGLLSRRPRSGWAWSRFAGDIMDLGLIASAFGRGHKGRLLAAGAAVAGIAAVDYFCSSKLSAGKENELAWKSRPVSTRKSVLVNRPARELYREWRDLSKIPAILRHIKSVEVTGNNRSRWSAKSPLGMTVFWEADLTLDEPGKTLAWRSVPESDVVTSGIVQFEDRGPDGTEVRLTINYEPGAHIIGSSLSRFFGKSFERQIAEDLQRFKQLMETGEVATVEGQPAGRKSSTVWYDEQIR